MSSYLAGGQRQRATMSSPGVTLILNEPLRWFKAVCRSHSAESPKKFLYSKNRTKANEAFDNEQQFDFNSGENRSKPALSLTGKSWGKVCVHRSRVVIAPTDLLNAAPLTAVITAHQYSFYLPDRPDLGGIIFCNLDLRFYEAAFPLSASLWIKAISDEILTIINNSNRLFLSEIRPSPPADALFVPDLDKDILLSMKHNRKNGVQPSASAYDFTTNQSYYSRYGSDSCEYFFTFCAMATRRQCAWSQGSAF